MKTRGTRGGILLSLDAGDNADSFRQAVAESRELFTNKVIIEVSEKLPYDLIETAVSYIRELGGEVTQLRPPGVVTQTKAETLVLARTIRSGALVEASGSLVILGDVNAGAELVAENDIIVVGNLRGVAHAGVSGNEHAIIWAQRILSPQLRIAGALAQAGDSSNASITHPEVAQLKDGQIMIRAWDK